MFDYWVISLLLLSSINPPDTYKLTLGSRFWPAWVLLTLRALTIYRRNILPLRSEPNLAIHIRLVDCVLQKSDDTLFGKYIVTKPNAKTSLCWMQIAIVAAIARIPCPTDITVDWLLQSQKVSNFVIWLLYLTHLETSVKPKDNATYVS
jgi:hypothetical protein